MQHALLPRDHVDAAVWEWIKSLLTDPEALADGLSEYQKEQEKATGPIRDRLAVVDDLLARNRGQLRRLLDLYLSGDFPKDMLTERKTRLEATIEALEKERTGLVAHLENQALTDEHIQSLEDFAAKVAVGLEVMDDDFKARRHVIELLDLQATLALEEEHKVVYARCIVGDNSLSVAPLSSGTRDNRSCRSTSHW